MDERTRQKHNALYNRAMKLAENEISLDSKHLPMPGLWTTFKLRRALALLAKVIALAPDRYAAYWFAGKIHQRFREHREAFDFFRRSAELNPTQPDVLREASISAMDADERDKAVEFARRAVAVEPENPGLHANLGLALLLDGNVAEARDEIRFAAAADPSDAITASLLKVIEHYQTTGAEPPRTMSELQTIAARLR